MKIRAGFVSNSSSSSFVLAKRKDCTVEDIEKIFLEYEDSINELTYNLEYLDDVGDLKVLNGGDEQIEKIAKMLSKKFCEEFEWASIDLGDWVVTAVEYSNDSTNLLDYFVYEHLGSIENDNLKIKATG